MIQLLEVEKGKDTQIKKAKKEMKLKIRELYNQSKKELACHEETR